MTASHSPGPAHRQQFWVQDVNPTSCSILAQSFADRCARTLRAHRRHALPQLAAIVRSGSLALACLHVGGIAKPSNLSRGCGMVRAGRVTDGGEADGGADGSDGAVPSGPGSALSSRLAQAVCGIHSASPMRACKGGASSTPAFTKRSHVSTRPEPARARIAHCRGTSRAQEPHIG